MPFYYFLSFGVKWKKDPLRGVYNTIVMEQKKFYEYLRIYFRMTIGISIIVTSIMAIIGIAVLTLAYKI